MFICIFLWAAWMGQDSEVTYEEKVTVRYVSLDVSATDAGGNPVDDLKPSDFVVKENKKKVQLTSFQKLEYATKRIVAFDLKTGKPSQSATADVSAIPQFILVLDMKSALVHEIEVIFKQLDAFLAARPNDQAQWMLYSMEDGLLTRDFESDPKTVQQKLNNYKASYFQRLEKRKKQMRRTPTSHLADNRTLAQLEEKLIQCRDRYNDFYNFENCAFEELSANIAIQQERVLRIMEELEALTYEFQERPGLKTMLFVSPGFSLKPGQAASNLTTYYRNIAGGNRGAGFGSDSDMRLESANGPNLMPVLPDYETHFQKVVHACVRNRVMFHTFDLFNHKLNRDAKDLSNEGLPKIIKHAYRDFGKELNEGLISLAQESGGRFFSGDSLLEPMTRLVEEPRIIYVLGYESPSGKSGKYRTIKIKCKRKDVALNHRKGYFGE